MDDLLKKIGNKMDYSVGHLREDLAKLRTGRASLAILEDIRVDYYGNPTPLSQVASLAVPDSATITIQPWENTILKDIEKTILASDLGLTPNNDGKMIRLSIPPLTQERRQQLVKVVKKYTEDCKVAIRNLRREFNDQAKAKEKKHEISKDEAHKYSENMQKVTDKHIAEIDDLARKKEKDVLEA